MSKIFLDTNILLYSVEDHFNSKHLIASNLMNENAVICSQVVSEFANVCRKRFKIDKFEVFRMVLEIGEYVEIVPVTFDVVLKAQFLSKKYDFQFFDAIIVASALLSGCTHFYSEDL